MTSVELAAWVGAIGSIVSPVVAVVGVWLAHKWSRDHRVEEEKQRAFSTAAAVRTLLDREIGWNLRDASRYAVDLHNLIQDRPRLFIDLRAKLASIAPPCLERTAYLSVQRDLPAVFAVDYKGLSGVIVHYRLALELSERVAAVYEAVKQERRPERLHRSMPAERSVLKAVEELMGIQVDAENLAGLGNPVKLLIPDSDSEALRSFRQKIATTFGTSPQRSFRQMIAARLYRIAARLSM